MQKEIVDQLRGLMFGFNDAIRAEMVKKNTNASGETSKELEVRNTDSSVESWGGAHIEILEKGRRPGTFPPVSNIRKWIRDKGLQSQNISVDSLFLIVRKIKNFGTEAFRNKSKRLDIDSIIEKFEPEFLQSAEGVTETEVVKKLNYFTKQFNKKSKV